MCIARLVFRFIYTVSIFKSTNDPTEIFSESNQKIIWKILLSNRQDYTDCHAIFEYRT